MHVLHLKIAIKRACVHAAVKYGAGEGKKSLAYLSRTEDQIRDYVILANTGTGVLSQSTWFNTISCGQKVRSRLAHFKESGHHYVFSHSESGCHSARFKVSHSASFEADHYLLAVVNRASWLASFKVHGPAVFKKGWVANLGITYMYTTIHQTTLEPASCICACTINMYMSSTYMYVKMLAGHGLHTVHTNCSNKCTHADSHGRSTLIATCTCNVRERWHVSL